MDLIEEICEVSTDQLTTLKFPTNDSLVPTVYLEVIKKKKNIFFSFIDLGDVRK